MARVVVFGAAGRTGSVVVDELVAAGHTITAAVRRPDAVPPRDGVAVVPADLADRPAVARALAGADVVVSTVGPAGRTAHGLYSGSARTFTHLLPAAGIDRLVVLSSAGVDASDPHLSRWYRLVARTVLRGLYRDMRMMEELLEGSTLAWTSVRSTRIVDEPTTGQYRVGDGQTPEHGTRIARTDLARFVAAAVGDDTWVRRFPTPAV